MANGMRKVHLYQRAAVAGLAIGEWSPGDGATRFRFFPQGPHTRGTNADYHGDGDIYTALGLGEAFCWIGGYIRGMDSGRKPDWNATPKEGRGAILV